MRGHRLMCAIFALALLTTQGCSRRSGRPEGGTRQSVSVRGSDTMVNLGQAWAEAYGASHPEANITVTGGGSGTGIAALINGTTDIAEASREMDKQEIEQARSRGRDPKQFVVARDGVTVIVNPSNTIGRLNISQLSDIYTGKILNWKQVGGADRGIVVLSRDTSSGTHVFFLEHVLRRGNPKGQEQYAKQVLFLPSSQAIADQVADNPAAIGYVGMGYVKPGREKPVSVAMRAGAPFVAPTPENVLNGTYPIARPLYFYTPGEPKGIVKDFVDFVLSDQGQKIVQQNDFVPIRKASAP